MSRSAAMRLTPEPSSPAASETQAPCGPGPGPTPGPGGLVEAQGSASADAELWALIFGRLEAGREIKIVVRMTGEGAISLRAVHDDSTEVKPVWVRPRTWAPPGTGDEWGTSWLFSKPGCWRIEVARDDGAGEIWLAVEQSP